MMMFGPRLNTVFASRWKALFWAVSVMVSAYFMVPHAEDGAQADSAAVAQIAGGEATGQTAPAASPWAK